MIRNWEEEASALFLQNQLEWQSLEKQLKLSVEASQIRALSDGIMNEVYVQEGQYVEASALLGMMHGSNVQIAATINAYDAFGLSSETTAVAVIENISVPVILVRKSGPDKQGTQTLWFKPLNEEAIKNLQTGDYARLEITQKTNPVSALIPFSAVDPDEQIWIVENGKAYALQIETNECNRTHIRAELGLVGKSVILHPEQYELKNGMPVRVMK